jgi:undecaprenyl-diphosphatase
MTLFQAFILGLVQGATEFIPVSSSGHLVLVPWLLGWELDPDIVFAFDVLVQWGTLVAVVAYFWRDLWAIVTAVLRGLIERKPLQTLDARLGWLLVAATLPAVVLGLLLKDTVEAAFDSETATAAFLLFTAALLTVSEWLGQRDRSLDALNWLDALWIGLGQALALFPGISRSGATIAAAMSRNVERAAAARFSFLMSAPVIFGAGLLPLKDMLEAGTLDTHLAPLGVGFVAAAVSGYLCIRGLLAFLRRRPLYVFAAYCLLFGCFNLLVAFLRG